ncbi:MAG: N-acetylglucosamine-6-phosphate deacetylase [Verrucomicrobiae bacterium]|nr:N-acetylglucosamine-6-phosphate deacetylase [Verrucomicrobiae bacterium]
MNPKSEISKTILSGATIHLPAKTLKTGSVVITNGCIAEIHEGALPNPKNGAIFIDLTGKILSAGFIDLHIHGMMGIDVMNIGPEGYGRLSAEAAKRGVTALAPTTVACPAEQLRKIMESIHAAREAGVPGAKLLGLHLESNFINVDFKGAQPGDQVFSWEDPRAAAIRKLLEQYARDTCIVTLAPEMPGGIELIRWLVKHGIAASMGHSGAKYDQAMAGIEAGATRATHLFNAMPPLHHRNPGLPGAVLSSPKVFAEMVCDGIHVHPAVIATTIAAKGCDRFMPISDGLEAAGMTSGDFLLGGQHVTVVNNVAKLDNGTIAGSITTMDRIVRLLVNQTGCDIHDALRMASATPAKGIGRQDIGRIVPGAAADLVVLTPDLEVETTLVDGKVVFSVE